MIAEHIAKSRGVKRLVFTRQPGRAKGNPPASCQGEKLPLKVLIPSVLWNKLCGRAETGHVHFHVTGSLCGQVCHLQLPRPPVAVLPYAITDSGFVENQPLLWHWAAGNLHLLSAFQKTGRSYSLKAPRDHLTATPQLSQTVPSMALPT